MNIKTAVVMFAVVAALGLVAATLVVPIVPQAHAQGAPPVTCKRVEGGSCKDFGLAQRETHEPPHP
jgi:hypothetical protein